MFRFSALLVLLASMSQIASPKPTSAKSDFMTESIPKCFVETILPQDKTKGVIRLDKVPDGSDPTKPCRTILESPQGKMLNLTLDFAFLKHERDFVRIKTHNGVWVSNETCKPCLGEVIESNKITIDFLLTNKSKLSLKYSVIDIVCPAMKINAPLFVAGEASVSRRIGSSLHLECIGKKSFELIGARNLSCEAAPNGLAAWSAPLPSCRKISNCPKVKKITETTGVLTFQHRKNENYECAWLITASDYDVNHIKFTPKFRWNELIPRRGSGSTRGLFFKDGRGRLSIARAPGKRYKTRDSKLNIYFKLSARELAAADDASFSVHYEISRKTCPAFPDGSFPFGSITLSDSLFAGSEAQFACASNYKLVGKSEAICTSEGSWNFEEMPKCVFVTGTENNVIDIPAVTQPSTPSAVTAEPHVEEERSEVTEMPHLELGTSNVSTVRPTPQIKKMMRTYKTNASMSSGSTEPSAATEPSIELSTSTAPSTSTEDSDSSTSLIPALEVGNATISELPVLQWAKDNIERLRNLDINNPDDKRYLWWAISAAASAVVFIGLCVVAAECCCGCCGKETEVPRRENPLYAGTPVRRTLSFRMPYGASRRAANNKRINNNNSPDEDETLPRTLLKMDAFP